MRFAVPLLIATCALGAVLVSAERQDQGASKVVPADDVSLPQLVKEVKPSYTRKARAAAIQGVVLLQAVVRSDGRVGDVRVVRSLDAKYGLDQQAVKAAKQWVFKPGMKDGKPVAVLVAVEMSFSLKGK